MIEVPISKDFRSYEPHIIGPFTSRQTLFGGIACAFAVGGYFLEKAMGFEDPLVFPFFLIFSVPPIIVGWFKPYGMKFEVFVMQAYQDNIKSPHARPYREENTWVEMRDEALKKEKESAKGQKKTRTPQNRLPEEIRMYR